MKKELLIIVIIFLILSLGMHYKEFFSYPLEHINNLPTSGAYGFGMTHPLLFTLLTYTILWLPRGIIKLFKRK